MSSGAPGNRLLKAWRFFPPLLVFILCLPMLDGTFRFSGGDNAIYLMLGRGLAAGKGYVEYWTVAAAAHAKYPPLFPAMIAAALKISGENLLALKIMLAALLSLTAFAAVYLSALRDRRLAILAAAAACSAPALAWHTGVLLSEVPYAFLSVLSLALAEVSLRRLADTGNGLSEEVSLPVPGRRAAEVLIFVSALLAVLASLCRSVGAALVIALFISFVRCGWKVGGKTRRPLFAAAGLMAVLYLAWPLRNLVMSGHLGGAYEFDLFLVDPYASSGATVTALDLGRRILGRLGFFYSIAARELLLLPEPGRGLSLVLGLALMLTMIPLFSRSRFHSPLPLYILFYLLAVGVWPHRQSRFMVPLLPLVGILAPEVFRELSILVSPSRTRFKKGMSRLAYLVCAWMLLAHVLGVVALDQKLKYEDKGGMAVLPTGTPVRLPHAGMRALWNTCVLVRKVVGPDDPVMSRKSSLVALAAERPVVDLPYTGPAEVLASIRANRVRYLIQDRIWPESERFLDPVLSEGGADFRELACEPDRLTCLYSVSY